MAQIFRFLKEEDMQTLLQTADHLKFEAEDFIIREGDQQTSIFIVRRGNVRVVREHIGFVVELSNHGSGEIFGEMSFIEGLPASASVQAMDDVEVVAINNRHILTIIRENPAFYGRFYHSLADILSRRVRETSEMVSATETPWAAK